jgi:NADH dehydrogenase/putative oxidoreductase
LAFERAEAAQTEAEREALLTFVIVGGGPTGVELAGAIAELARFGMANDFRTIDPSKARVILVEAGPRLLAAFPPALSEEAKNSLEGLGVEVRINGRVESVEQDGVIVSGGFIPSRCVLWAAGVAASPAGEWLSADVDRAGRIKVLENLSIPGHPGIFAVGDTAAMVNEDLSPVPGLAPAAKQSGTYVAALIDARVAGKPEPTRFRYTHLGSLATIGRKAAVADFGVVKLTGMAAWWLWGLVHVAFLVGARNRTAVLVDWFWSYLTFRRGIRLITGEEKS